MHNVNSLLTNNQHNNKKNIKTNVLHKIIIKLYIQRRRIEIISTSLPWLMAWVRYGIVRLLFTV